MLLLRSLNRWFIARLLASCGMRNAAGLMRGRIAQIPRNRLTTAYYFVWSVQQYLATRGCARIKMP